MYVDFKTLYYIFRGGAGSFTPFVYVPGDYLLDSKLFFFLQRETIYPDDGGLEDLWIQKRKLAAFFRQAKPAMKKDMSSHLHDKCCFIEKSLTRLYILLISFFLSTSPLFAQEMAMQILLNNSPTQSGFCPASVYRSKSGATSASSLVGVVCPL